MANRGRLTLSSFSPFISPVAAFDVRPRSTLPIQQLFDVPHVLFLPHVPRRKKRAETGDVGPGRF